MAEDCEKCAEQARMKEIAENLEKTKNLLSKEKGTCTLCDGKTEPSDRNKVVSGEYTKTLIKEDEREGMKAWYEAITRYSQQLREALLGSESFVNRMLEIHKELNHYDIKKDNGIIVNKLGDMKNLAQMAQVDIELIKRTLEQIECKVHGNS